MNKSLSCKHFCQMGARSPSFQTLEGVLEDTEDRWVLSALNEKRPSYSYQILLLAAVICERPGNGRVRASPSKRYV